MSISTNNLEAILVQAILPSHSKLLLVCCYRPPDSNDMSDFRSLADNFFSSYEQVIIAGNFNLPNINWMDSNYTCNGALDQEFCDILDDYFMSQHCLLPTRKSNILDLLITNHPKQVSILDICDPKEVGMSSDHRVVRFKVLSPVSSTKQPKRLVFDYKRADFESLRNRLTELDICSLLSNNEKEFTIDDDWSVWKNAVLSVVYEYIPTKYVDPRRTPPWITPSILHQVRKKVTARKRFLSRGSAYFKEKFNKLRADVKKAVQ